MSVTAKIAAVDKEGKPTTSVRDLHALLHQVFHKRRGIIAVDVTFSHLEGPKGSIVWHPTGEPLRNKPVTYERIPSDYDFEDRQMARKGAIPAGCIDLHVSPQIEAILWKRDPAGIKREGVPSAPVQVPVHPPSLRLDAGEDETMRKTQVFVVHGHDDGPKQAVARFLERLGFEAVILHERPDLGATLIEKLERNVNVAFAVVLLTADDVGGAKGPAPVLCPRPRQNVVFEWGHLVAKLGRPLVHALRCGNVEISSDMQGILYTEFDAGGAWQTKLAREMEAAGIKIDWQLFGQI